MSSCLRGREHHAASLRLDWVDLANPGPMQSGPAIRGRSQARAQGRSSCDMRRQHLPRGVAARLQGDAFRRLTGKLNCGAWRRGLALCPRGSWTFGWDQICCSVYSQSQKGEGSGAPSTPRPCVPQGQVSQEEALGHPPCIRPSPHLSQ